MPADEDLSDDDWGEELPPCTVAHNEGTITSDDTLMVADAFENDDFWLPPTTNNAQPTARASGTMAASSLDGGDHHAQGAVMTRDSWRGSSMSARSASSFSMTERHVGDSSMSYVANVLVQSSCNGMSNHTQSGRPHSTNGKQAPSNNNQFCVSHGQFGYHNTPPLAARVESSWSVGGSTPSDGLFRSHAMAMTSPPSLAVTQDNARSTKKAGKKDKGLILQPLTAYNFYYRFERDRLLKSDAFDPLSVTCRQDNPYQSILENGVDFQKKMLHEHWSQDRSVKRKHCKSHGRISFQALTKHVAQSWRVMPEPVKHVFKAISARDQYRYALEKEALDVSHSQREK